MLSIGETHKDAIKGNNQCKRKHLKPVLSFGAAHDWLYLDGEVATTAFTGLQKNEYATSNFDGAFKATPKKYKQSLMLRVINDI